MSDSTSVPYNREDAPSDSGRSAPAKLLQLRKARFRGAAVSSSNVAPAALSNDTKSLDGVATSTKLEEELPPSAPNNGGASCPVSGDHGILQEISNSSMRRKRRSISSEDFTGIKADRTKPLQFVSEAYSIYQPLRQSPEQELELSSKQRERRVSKSKHAADFQETQTSSLRNRRSTGSRRSLRGDISSGYVEQLEHQISLLEAQIQSLTSPSKLKTQSVKLRALSAETKTLRQEVADWESKFDQRVREQLDQQEALIGSLRAQTRAMKKAVEVTDVELEDVRADNAVKTRHLEATELLNQDLEKRLEMMSNLLASSPTKSRFGDDIWSHAQRGTPKKTSPLRRLPISPSRAFETKGFPFEPTSPTLVARSTTASPTGTHEPLGLSAKLAPHLQGESEPSEMTFKDDPSASPSRRRWTTQLSMNKPEIKSRPSRRMRRFYGSCVAPKALILPAAAYPGSYSASTPSTPFAASHFPTISADILENNQQFMIAHRNPSDTIETAGWTSQPFIDQASSDESDANEDICQVQSSPRQSSSEKPTPLADNTSILAHANQAASLQRDFIPPTLFQELEGLENLSDTEESLSKPNSVIEAQDLSTVSPESVKCVAAYQQMTPGVDYHSPKTAQSLLVSHKLPFPFTLLASLAGSTSRTLEKRSPRVKLMITNAWSRVTLSRPVLEFRWWLVKLLVGGIHKQGQLLQPFEVGLGTKIPPELSERTAHKWPNRQNQPGSSPCVTSTRKRDHAAKEFELNIWEVFKTRERHRHATPPPVSWLKFSITLVFAVGIAIKDGPASLFKAREGIGDMDEHLRSHRE